MAISERRRLTFTIIAVIGLAIVTGLLIYSLFLSPKTPMTTTTPTTTATTTLTPGPFEVRISGFAFEPPSR